LEICLAGLKAVEGAPESPDIAYLYQETGRAYFFNDLPKDASIYCEKALDLAERLNAYDVQAEALATIGILPTTEPGQAVSALERAIEISETNGLFNPASRAYINLAVVKNQLGQFRVAREYLRRALNLGDKAGSLSNESEIQQEIIQGSLWLADFEDAERQISHMSQISNGKNPVLDEKTLDLLHLQGTLYRLKGDFQSAIETFSELIERSRQTHDNERTLNANLALAEVIIDPYLINRDKAARSNIDLAFSMVKDTVDSTTQPSSEIQISAYCLLSELYVIKGDLLAAEETIEQTKHL
jgi:tetratricopeptide (TPR) repeat protein